MCNLV